MQVRLVITKPRKKYAPLTGLLYYVDGQIVGQAILQTRRNKTSMWETAEVVNQEDVNDFIK